MSSADWIGGRWVRWLTMTVWLLHAPESAAQALQAQQTDPSDHDLDHVSLFQPREASGTAWQPDATPMYGFHGDVGRWTYMFHGNVFAQFLYELGATHRTSHQAGSVNWVMGMLRRPIGSGRVGVRTMLSLEPWTISGCGYPDLLATGEICDGDSIHDRQHPHDLFMELAVDYDRSVTRSLRWQAYAALAGEPALGPPGFPHRPSAFPNPIAPISHHWLDSTHIAYGIVTSGLYGHRWKAEASVFNGREPDDSRADFEFEALDSAAARLSFMPNDRLALQISAGHLRQAEAGVGSQPRQDVNRVTASVAYHRPLPGGGFWATTMAYGVNDETSLIPGGPIDQTTHAILLEASLANGPNHTWFGRVDVVGKPAHDLHIHEYITNVFTVAKFQLGYMQRVTTLKGWASAVGAHLNLSVVPPLLAPRYNGRVAPGVGVFFNLRPSEPGASALRN